jgi:hypothetical protein
MQLTPRETRRLHHSRRKRPGTRYHCRQPKHPNLLQSRKGHERTTLNTGLGRRLVIRSLKAGAERLTFGASQIISLHVTRPLTLQTKFDSDRQLTGIPAQFIHDLNKMTVLRGIENLSIGTSSVSPVKPDAIAGRRLFTRVQTAPATSSSHFRGPNPWEKSVSFNSFLSGNSNDAVQLFLAKNNMSKVPLELSRLENLTFLSLRRSWYIHMVEIC